MSERAEDFSASLDQELKKLPAQDDTLAPESPLGGPRRRASPVKEAMMQLKEKKGVSLKGSRKPFTPEEKKIVQAVAQGISTQESLYATHAAQIENQQRLVRESLAKAKPERKIKAMQAAFRSKPSSKALGIDRIPTRSEIREESSLGALSRRAAEDVSEGAKMPALQETDETIAKVPGVNPVVEQSFKVEPEAYDPRNLQYKKSEEPKGWLARGWAKVKSWF